MADEVRHNYIGHDYTGRSEGMEDNGIVGRSRSATPTTPRRGRRPLGEADDASVISGIDDTSRSCGSRRGRGLCDEQQWQAATRSIDGLGGAYIVMAYVVMAHIERARLLVDLSTALVVRPAKALSCAAGQGPSGAAGQGP